LTAGLRAEYLAYDYNSETLDSFELGINGATDKLSYEITTFVMRKKNFIFRDAEGFNVSNGQTRHLGIESMLRWQLTESFGLSANLSWARHEYDFNQRLFLYAAGVRPVSFLNTIANWECVEKPANSEIRPIL
jgi:outer membrane receptor protein involved in Fe transport